HPHRRDHHLHRHPKRLRHLPTLLRPRRVPPRDPGSRPHRRSRHLAHPVARGGPDQPPHPHRSAHLLLHLYLERVPAPPGLPGLQPEPDRPARPRRRTRRTHRRRHHASRLRTTRHPARHRLLPHLPTHTHPRHHRRRGEVSRLDPDP